jgi:hypothetical protein
MLKIEAKIKKRQKRAIITSSSTSNPNFIFLNLPSIEDWFKSCVDPVVEGKLSEDTNTK